jgi:epsin
LATRLQGSVSFSLLSLPIRSHTHPQSLTVLDYCLHQGSENVVIYFRDNLYVVKTLKEFQYVDEDGKDQGANVRQKAKDITNLLIDESRLREERRARASMRDRMIRGAANGGGEFGDQIEYGLEDENRSRMSGASASAGAGAGAGAGSSRGKNNKRMDDDGDLRKAIEESKKTLMLEQQAAEERELQEAIQLSRQEEEQRKHAVEDSNARSLFDDQQQLYVFPSSYHYLTHGVARLQAESSK